jgi:hypothetical protein
MLGDVAAAPACGHSAFPGCAPCKQPGVISSSNCEGGTKMTVEGFRTFRAEEAQTSVLVGSPNL